MKHNLYVALAILAALLTSCVPAAEAPTPTPAPVSPSVDSTTLLVANVYQGQSVSADEIAFAIPMDHPAVAELVDGKYLVVALAYAGDESVALKLDQPLLTISGVAIAATHVQPWSCWPEGPTTNADMLSAVTSSGSVANCTGLQGIVYYFPWQSGSYEEGWAFEVRYTAEDRLSTTLIWATGNSSGALFGPHSPS